MDVERSPIFYFLDRPIAFHRALVPVAGSVTAALLLCQALYWSKRTRDATGWFYKTQAEWEEETGMSRWEQEGARKLLKQRALLEEKRAGAPAKLYFRVNIEAVENSALLNAEKPHTGSRKNLKQDGGSAAKKMKEKPQSLIAETTTETTAESTANDTAAPAESAGDGSAIPPEPDYEAHTDDPPAIGSDPTNGSPDRKQIVDEIHRLYQFHNPGIKVPWTDLAFLRMKREVARVKGWTTEQWLDCVRNRYASDGIILGELPESFIPYLSRYISGPMDRYGKAKGANSGNVSARTARNRAALAEVVGGIRKGFGIAERAG
jgi:hypothetical protein